MEVILALDVGSSSARCSAYQILPNHDATAVTVQALDGCSAQRKIRSVQPNTGKIILNGQTEQGEAYSLLDEIDSCIDTTLQALRQHHHAHVNVVGLGFSTFVMNLVGVDSDGNAVGEEATMSYACNSPEVAQECRNLKR
jgi:ribulose kinase